VCTPQPSIAYMYQWEEKFGSPVDQPDSQTTAKRTLLWAKPAKATRQNPLSSFSLQRRTPTQQLPLAKEERMQSPDPDSAPEAVESETSLMEIRRAAGLLFRAGDVVEVRVPKAGRQRTISGYFSDFEQLAQAVERLDRNRWPGIYWTINPVNPALEARSQGKLKSFAEYDIPRPDLLCRRWLPVDLDPTASGSPAASGTRRASSWPIASVPSWRQTVGRKPSTPTRETVRTCYNRVDLPNTPETTDF